MRTLLSLVLLATGADLRALEPEDRVKDLLDASPVPLVELAVEVSRIEAAAREGGAAALRSLGVVRSLQRRHGEAFALLRRIVGRDPLAERELAWALTRAARDSNAASRWIDALEAGTQTGEAALISEAVAELGLTVSAEGEAVVGLDSELWGFLAGLDSPGDSRAGLADRLMTAGEVFPTEALELMGRSESDAERSLLLALARSSGPSRSLDQTLACSAEIVDPQPFPKARALGAAVLLRWATCTVYSQPEAVAERLGRRSASEGILGLELSRLHALSLHLLDRSFEAYSLLRPALRDAARFGPGVDARIQSLAAECATRMGWVEAASEHRRAALRQAARARDPQVRHVALAEAVWALLEQRRPLAALPFAEIALKESLRWGHSAALVEANLQLARTKAALGELGPAERLVAEAGSLVAAIEASPTRVWLELQFALAKAELKAAQGTLGQAAETELASLSAATGRHDIDARWGLLTVLNALRSGELGKAIVGFERAARVDGDGSADRRLAYLRRTVGEELVEKLVEREQWGNLRDVAGALRGKPFADQVHRTGERVLSYLVTESSTLIFVDSVTRPVVFECGRRCLTATLGALEISRGPVELLAQLVAPLAQGDASTVVVEPDDILWEVPFASLVPAGSDRTLGERVVLRHRISTRTACRSGESGPPVAGSARVVVLTSSTQTVDGLPELPRAEAEAERVEMAWLQRAPTAAGLNVLHVAGHSEYVHLETDTGSSGLVLRAEGSGEVAMGDVDVLVMGTCSAIPQLVQRGWMKRLVEGGLRWAVGPVVALDDDASADLMPELHRFLAEGLDPAEALFRLRSTSMALVHRDVINSYVATEAVSLPCIAN